MTKTKNLILALILGTLCTSGTLAAEKTVTFPVEERQASPREEVRSMEPSVTIYPSEVFFGDSIFLRHHDKNVGEKTAYTNAVPMIYDYQYVGQRYRVTAEGVPGEYVPMWESLTSGHGDWGPSRVTLNPGETGVTEGIELELPPLEDWDTEFWRAVRENLPPEGRKLTITVHLLPWMNGLRSEPLSAEILLKPRPEAEMKILEDWYRLTDHEDFPEERNLLYAYLVKGPRKGKTASGWYEKGSSLELGGKTFRQSQFLRFPHRKPPMDLAPKTLGEWRKLRDSFGESSLRAELEFTVLVMEYYNAYRPDNPAPQREKREEICRWILAQPEVLQPWWAKRMMDLALLDAKWHWYDERNSDPDRLARGRDFYRALYPMLHPVNQKKIRERIPEMREEDEIARLTEKQKAEGWRLWYDQDGKFLYTARLMGAGSDWAYLEIMFIGSGGVSLQQLSEADQKYVEEKRKAPN